MTGETVYFKTIEGGEGLPWINMSPHPDSKIS